ncbi:MAG: hypothetical protein F4Z79_02600 [Acidimicrobiia bacterium]|nr:hypothetical protein [bacterium]MXX00497.1 hypothetical protein [Acidimicrobiia bacterium]MDE0675362.1 hypothetical protein [bacterium]MYA39538.1 hypothetical protein [Acidimicrobiia bacterium]MYH05153.1 hypothetical protein [Acidimicrobiia bacterium]
MISLVNLGVALLIGVVVWRLCLWFLRAMAAAPDQPDPDSIVEAYQDYRCTLCGTELTVRMASVSETSPPRHCREEMVAVWRPETSG